MKKSAHNPVSGTNFYSVFKNGELVCMMDGNRMSVFRPDDVETIIVNGTKEYILYKVGSWIFTGNTNVPLELFAELPAGCTLCPAFGKEVEV